MLDMIRPAGLATAGRREAKKGDALATRPSNSQNKRAVQAAIRTQLSGSDTCTAPGIPAPWHVLHRDYETRSRAILQKVGAHRYAGDPQHRNIMCCLCRR